MIEVKVPKDYHKEITYIIDCLLGDFLSIPYEVKISDVQDTILSYQNQKIIVENHFFKGDFQELYSHKNLPHTISEGSIHIDGELFNYVTLYGESQISFDQNGIRIHFDLIASSFFMLSRWEEGISDEVDSWGRFDFRHAISVKNKFYDRPIVNEYLEILTKILQKIGVKIPSTKSYKPIISFDIDSVKKWKNGRSILQAIFNNLKAKKINYLTEDIYSLLKALLKKNNDPANNFNYIIDTLNEKEIKDAIFYFKTGKTDDYFDKNEYDILSIDLKETISKILQNEFTVGIHPSYHTFLSKEQLANETAKLKAATGSNILEHSRQHYLRFKVPNTWNILNELSVKYDSSMIYSYKAGFRCGICYDFPVFDYQKRKTLEIREIPLLLMETNYLKNSKLDILKDAAKITETVKSYRGINMMLWHNENLDFQDRRQNFEKLLHIIR
jgi:hypothetical protein